MNAPPTKPGLRAELRRARRSLPPEQAAAEAAATVAALRAWFAGRPPSVIASYLAIPAELDLSDLHACQWTAGLPVWLPAVRGDQLDWHPVTCLDQVRPGAYAVREPDPDRVPAATLPPQAVVLVPGVGFGRDGRRLGQGGGFYDRFLATHAGPAIGVGFACQRCDELPLDLHDHPVRGVVLGGTWVRHPESAAPGPRATDA